MDIKFFSIPLLSLVTAMAVGCRAGAPVKSAPIASHSESTTRISVAPVFIHGQGYGSEGCFHSLPQGSISEETARDYILRQFQSNGIEFDRLDVPIDDVLIDHICGYERFEEENKITGQKRLNIDGFSSKYNLGFEYVSHEDHNDLGGVNTGCSSTTSDYDVLSVAQKLRNTMVEYGKMNFIVFYDPMYDPYDFPIHKRDKALMEKEWTVDLDTIQENQGKEIVFFVSQISDGVRWLKQERIIAE